MEFAPQVSTKRIAAAILAHRSTGKPRPITMEKTTTPPYRLYRPESSAQALGLAVNHLMTKPAFANLRFGEWSRILVGQINRRHFYFVVDPKNRVQGFAGWALTTRDKAEAWVEG